MACKCCVLLRTDLADAVRFVVVDGGLCVPLGTREVWLCVLPWHVSMERRRMASEAAERIVVEDDLPVIPIATYKTLYMYEPGRVRGFTHHPRLEQHPARWRIERD